MRRIRELQRYISSIPARLGRPGASESYVPQIDGLRFFAIAIVLIWHASLRADRFVDHLNQRGQDIPNLYPWFPHGEVGVALFFVISGFVISRPFISRPRGEWRIQKFYVNRFWRIYPPYLAVLLLCFLLAQLSNYRSAVPGISNTTSFLASIFYVHGLVFDVASRLNPPIWSLEIEIEFYLLAPLVLSFYLMPRQPMSRIILGSACILALIATSALLNHLRPFDGRFRFGLIAHFHLFLIGIILADVLRIVNLRSYASAARFDFLLICGVGSMLLAGWYLTEVDARPIGYWSYVLCNMSMSVATICVFLGAMFGRIGVILFGAPWIAFIGAMVYSIYLVHVVVMEVISVLVLRYLPLWDVTSIYCVFIGVLVVFSVVCGGLFYIAVERRFMSRGSAPVSTPVRRDKCLETRLRRPVET